MQNVCFAAAHRQSGLGLPGTVATAITDPTGGKRTFAEMRASGCFADEADRRSIIATAAFVHIGY
jgi:hypothetical protein